MKEMIFLIMLIGAFVIGALVGAALMTIGLDKEEENNEND